VRFTGSGADVPKGEQEYDLLVGADGIGSKIRHEMLRDSGKEEFVPINWVGALFTVPSQEDDPLAATALHLPGRRMIMTRKDKPDCLRISLAFAGEDPELDAVLKSGTVEEKKQKWVDMFIDDAATTAQLPRYLDGLLHSPMADDLYNLVMGQVKADTWSRGRVVLLGDAGYCPSPASGLGTTVALGGAYVLAGEIARACGGAPSSPKTEVPAALAAYERELRPLVKDAQKLFPGTPWIGMPESAWGISVLHWFAWLLVVSKVERLAILLSSDKKGGWEVPEYAEFEQRVL
jgi:2-polyprenyl-6-methoxyphenol hydroxylase-like FAD-dependent oxidoreductase